MCNIAGYVGEKRAAPILLEMIRRQQIYDGGCCAGIVTIHEGKFYMRKVVGSLEDLIENTDALDLPGTIGIAHTRPSGGVCAEVAHPFISSSGKTASVANGTSRGLDPERATDMCDMLYRNGYRFSSVAKMTTPYPYGTRDGQKFHPADAFGAMAEHYIATGAKSYPEAMAKMMADFYADTVSVMLNVDNENEIFVTRNARPMFVLCTEGETTIATAPFGFLDEDRAADAILLPTLKSTVIDRSGYTVTDFAVDAERVSTITPAAYDKSYAMIEKMLIGKSDLSVCYDDIENELYYRGDEIWDERHTLAEYASLAYKVLFALKREGRLKGEIRPAPKQKRNLLYMYI